MLLHHEYTKVESAKGNLVLIHGLFGSLSNLGMLARGLQDDFNILQIDLRNHGLSPHSPVMNYEEMAKDVIETLDHLGIQQFSVIGHSMGGKVAMKLTALVADRVQRLVVLDMSPYAYPTPHHDHIIQALMAVAEAKVASRKEATEIMQHYIQEIGVIQFLLKSFDHGQWKFNVQILQAEYQQILSWHIQQPWPHPVLFLKGELSDYITSTQQQQLIQQQFPQARIETIKGASHWLHAEKTEAVLNAIRNYFQY